MSSRLTMVVGCVLGFYLCFLVVMGNSLAWSKLSVAIGCVLGFHRSFLVAVGAFSAWFALSVAVSRVFWASVGLLFCFLLCGLHIYYFYQAAHMLLVICCLSEFVFIFYSTIFLCFAFCYCSSCPGRILLFVLLGKTTQHESFNLRCSWKGRNSGVILMVLLRFPLIPRSWFNGRPEMLQTSWPIFDEPHLVTNLWYFTTAKAMWEYLRHIYN